MPKKTFFHLPEEKQKRLLEAARIEFSRASLKDASISNIIKLAEIPRGSFYQYFENKEDLYFFYFDQLRRDTKAEFKKAIKKADGDVLLGAEHYFTKLIYDVLLGENAAFFKNVFMNMDYRSSRHMTAKFDSPDAEKRKHQKHHEASLTLWNMVDHKHLKFSSPKEFSMFMHMLMAQVFTTIANGYRQLQLDENYQVEQSIQEFRMQLNWFRDGIYVRKEGK